MVLSREIDAFQGGRDLLDGLRHVQGIVTEFEFGPVLSIENPGCHAGSDGQTEVADDGFQAVFVRHLLAELGKRLAMHAKSVDLTAKAPGILAQRLADAERLR